MRHRWEYDADDDFGERHTTMNEQDMYRLMMWAGAVLAAIAGLATVVLLVMTVSHGLFLIIPTILLAAVTIGCGIGATYFGQRFTGHEKVFSNAVEQEVLTRKQRRELRNARGGLVLERSLIEIEHERQNIVHRQIEAAHDPDKPPHKTRFNADEFDDVPRRLARGDHRDC